MPIAPTNLAQSMAAAAGTTRVGVRPADKNTRDAKTRPRAEDQFVSEAADVQTTQAPRSLKGNDQEEAHGEHPNRQDASDGDPNHRRPRLDLSA